VQVNRLSSVALFDVQKSAQSTGVKVKF